MNTWVAHILAFVLIIFGGLAWSAIGGFSEERKHTSRDVDVQLQISFFVGLILFVIALIIV